MSFYTCGLTFLDESTLLDSQAVIQRLNCEIFCQTFEKKAQTPTTQSEGEPRSPRPLPGPQSLTPTSPPRAPSAGTAPGTGRLPRSPGRPRVCQPAGTRVPPAGVLGAPALRPGQLGADVGVVCVLSDSGQQQPSSVGNQSPFTIQIQGPSELAPCGAAAASCIQRELHPAILSSLEGMRRPDGLVPGELACEGRCSEAGLCARRGRGVREPSRA